MKIKPWWYLLRFKIIIYALRKMRKNWLRIARLDVRMWFDKYYYLLAPLTNRVSCNAHLYCHNRQYSRISKVEFTVTYNCITSINTWNLSEWSLKMDLTALRTVVRRLKRSEHTLQKIRFIENTNIFDKSDIVVQWCCY